MLLLAIILCAGCASTLHLESKRQLRRFDGGGRPVFVTNPGLQREYEILRASGTYQLVSERRGARALTLYPIRRYGGCANSLMLTGLTLGLLPGTVPALRVFSYDLETDGIVERCEHRLALYERFSVWEWLLCRDDRVVMAKALAWSQAQRLEVAVKGRERVRPAQPAPAAGRSP